MSFLILGRLLANFLWDVLTAPFWWYSFGWWWWSKKMLAAAREQWETFAVGLWIKNILVPMYGQGDFWGRIVSFGMRLANIVGRILAWLVWAAILLVGWIVWPLLPLVASGWIFAGQNNVVVLPTL